MKIRQFFKNFFKKIVDKYRESLLVTSSHFSEKQNALVQENKNNQQDLDSTADSSYRKKEGKPTFIASKNKIFQSAPFVENTDNLSPNSSLRKNQIKEKGPSPSKHMIPIPLPSQPFQFKQPTSTFPNTTFPNSTKIRTHPIKKNKLSSKLPSFKNLTLKNAQKAHFVRQLSVLLNAGMDLCSALETLEEQEYRNRKLQAFIHFLLLKIEAGEALSNALASVSTSFGTSEIAMLRAGEAIGQQAETLTKLARLIEKKLLVKKKIISAFFYPVTVLGVSSVVVLLLTIFVIPKFEKIIADQLGSDAMPALTATIIRVSRFISGHSLILITTLGFSFLLIIGMHKLVLFQKIFYGIFLKIPILGDCVTKWSVVLFARTFGDLLLCGCSLVESLEMARASLGNFFMRERLSKTVHDVQQGMSLTESLRRQSVFPAMAEGLIQVGEESGKLGEMMNRISETYETQLDETISRITALLEPILVVFLAIFVGTVVIGLFLPLVSLIQNIGE